MKTTWKRLPVPLYHIAAMERKLEQMAAKGLLFRKLWGSFAQFDVNEPKPGRRYRLAVAPDVSATPPAQMKELYEQSGWQFVTAIWGCVFFVFCSDDPQAPEPYTDGPSHADSMPPLVRACRWHLLNCAALSVVIYLQFLHLRKMTITGGGFPLLIALLALFVLFYLLSSLQELYSVLRMKRMLAQGLSLDQFAPPRSQLAVQSVQDILWVVILLASVSGLLLSCFDDKPVPLDQAPPEAELLLLSDLEGPGYVPGPFHGSTWYPGEPSYLKDLGMANYFQTYWLSWSPHSYAAEQVGTAADGSHPRLSVQRYELRFACLTDQVLEELTDGVSCREIAVPGADRFLITENGTVYAALGRRVIRVTYSGTQDLSEWYDEIVDMLQAKP